jgi:hypothetical protein
MKKLLLFVTRARESPRGLYRTPNGQLTLSETISISFTIFFSFPDQSMYMHEMLYKINRQGLSAFAPFGVFDFFSFFLKGQRRGRESPTCHILPLIGPEADTK